MRLRQSRPWIVFGIFWAILMVLQLIPLLADQGSVSIESIVEPRLVQANSTCNDLVPGSLQIKTDSPGNGALTDGSVTVTIANFDTTSFDWQANIGIDAVLVTTGTEANLYVYDPELASDTALISPGQEDAISQVLFCYDVDLQTSSLDEITVTPTHTMTATHTPITFTPTHTMTATHTPITFTPTYTMTATHTPITFTPTYTMTATHTPITFTPTYTMTATHTPITFTPTYTMTATHTPVVPTPTYTMTPTNTPVPPTLTPTQTPTPTNTPTPVKYQGCTPGYWRGHAGSWAAAGYSPNQTLESVFDVPDSLNLDNVTLMQGLSFKGGSNLVGSSQILLRSAIAALLNSAHPQVDYKRITSSVINDVNAALASGNRSTILSLATSFDADNNKGCPLN